MSEMKAPATDQLPSGYLNDQHLEHLETVLDDLFTVPIIGHRVGVDGLAGLIPGVGDAMTAGLAALFVLEALKLGASKSVVARMAGNVAVDMAVGAIPIVGDLFDFAFKANRKNLALLRAEKQRLADRTQSAEVISAGTRTTISR